MDSSTPCSPRLPALPGAEKLSNPNPGLKDGRVKATMSSSASQETLFSLLPKTRKPWTEFVFSTGMQAAVVVLLMWVRLLYPTVVAAPEHTFRSVELVSTPVPVNHQPQPLLRLRQPAVIARLDPPADALRLPAPLPKAPVKVEDETAPTVTIAASKLEPAASGASACNSQAGGKDERIFHREFGYSHVGARSFAGADRRLRRP